MTKEEVRIGHLQIIREGHVATVTMDRPAKLNAMTAGFWKDMRDALELLEADRDIRAVIVTGAGERAFSAGGDIAGFLELEGRAALEAYQRDAMATFVHVENMPVPVIAAVNGLALGGGCELAMACDIVIAGAGAAFALPETALGLVPGFGAVRGPEIVGRQMMKYLIATGDPVDAERAMAIGLVNIVAPDEDLMESARALAARIAARSPNAVSVAKRMINSTIDRSAIEYSVAEITALQLSDDRRRGVEAFVARRAPVFGARPDGAGR